MQQYKSAILVTFLTLLFSSSWLKAQEPGGPYTTDENTILLMHFDGNLNEEVSSYSVSNHGITKSYIENPIFGLSNAIYFDNSIAANKSYLSVPYSSELSMNNSWTIEFWLKINSWDQSYNNWPVPILLPSVGSDANYYLEIPASWERLKYGFSSSDGGAQILSSPNSITPGTWYHIALINDYDNHTIKLILHDSNFNKLEEQSTTYTSSTAISTGTQDLRIGAGLFTENHFDGYIDELRISNVVRDFSVNEYDWQTTSSDNFLFHYTNEELLTENLINTLEKKFNNLDNIIWQDWRGIYLLDRSQKINIFLYDIDESLVNASDEVRDWDVGYYTENEIHIKVPTAERQLKYFPTFEKAAISVLARYVMAKKRTHESSKGLSFGFGLFESGYSPDLDVIRSYLSANNNTFPNSSAFSTWAQLDEELNVELAYTHVFASIFRHGYFMGTVYDGLYESKKEEWYQIIRIFFLIDIEDGGMKKFYEGDDFIIYSNSQEEADLSLEAFQWYADQYEESFGVRINHPLLVTMYGSDETYRYTERGNIDNIEEIGGGGEALSHSLLRASPATENLDTERDKLFTKYNGLIGHEFMHNVFAFFTEAIPPSWLNEGSAMYGDVGYLQGYNGVNVNNMKGFHDFFWNTNSMYFPDLDQVFDMDGNFGYRMGTSAFTFIKNNFPKETLLQFLKRSDDFSIIGYSNIDEFQRHLYESLYHQYIPSFLFNPNWDLERTFAPGTNFTFSWDGHYINDLIIEYSVDGMSSWNNIAEVSFSSGSFSWNVPNVENCILRFSDKKFPDINFPFQIIGNKPTVGKVFNMTFENGAVNNISIGNNGSGKDYVLYESRDAENGKFAKFNGLWNAITVQNYPSLNLSEDWTIQGDFLIENTTGVINTKPVLLEKISTGYWAKNYSVSFNKNEQNHLFFEYRLENNNIVILEIDDAEISKGNWYTFYFARSVENNIVEARVYDKNRNLLSSEIKQIGGEGKVLTGAGDLYLGSGDFYHNERCLQGGLDNIIISDTYHNELIQSSSNNVPVVSNIPNQTIIVGSTFEAVQLDNYVTDSDNSDSEITWSYSGNTDLSISIDDSRVVTISKPNTEWIGSEAITFTATDPEGGSGSVEVVFTARGKEFIGGPYASDENTILLLHFDGNLNEGASNHTVSNHGLTKSYITSPIMGQGDAIYFDNRNSENQSYITVPYFPELTMSSNWTIEFWFNINSWDKDHNNWPTPIILPTEGFDSNYYLEIPASWGRLKYGFTSSDEGAQVLSTQNSITPGTWYHVALINDYGNHTVKLILHDSDLQLLEEQSASFTAGTTIHIGTKELRIGAGLFSENYFDGYIDELRISNIVRSFEPVSVNDRKSAEIVTEYILNQNYPNPFNPSTMIKYGLPEQSNVKIEIFNMLGQSVSVLVNSDKSAGYYETTWDASNLPSGIYLISIIANGINSEKNFIQVKKALLIK